MEGKQMSILSDIASYVQGLDLSKEDPLKFLVEDNIRTNPFHKYTTAKQYEIRTQH